MTWQFKHGGDELSNNSFEISEPSSKMMHLIAYSIFSQCIILPWLNFLNLCAYQGNNSKLAPYKFFLGFLCNSYRNVLIFRIINLLQVDYKWTLGVYQFFIFKIEKVFYFSFLYLHVFMFGQKSILFTNKCKL